MTRYGLTGEIEDAISSISVKVDEAIKELDKGLASDDVEDIHNYIKEAKSLMEELV